MYGKNRPRAANRTRIGSREGAKVLGIGGISRRRRNI